MHEVERECPEGAQSRREGASGRSSWFQGAADLMEMGGGGTLQAQGESTTLWERWLHEPRMWGRKGSTEEEEEYFSF